MEKKIAVVTGASTGIGLATCRELREDNYKVIAISRRATQSDGLHKYEDIDKYDVDLRDENQVKEIVEKIYSNYGKIDVLINNAGIGLIKKLEETSLEEFNQQYEANMVTMFLMTREVIKNKNKDDFLHMVNTSSEAGVEGFATYSAYCASKFAVTGFSEAIKDELKLENVKVDVICPGDVNTPFMEKCPIDKSLMDEYSIEVLDEEYMLKPEDVSNLIINLLRLPKNVVMSHQKIQPVDNYY